MTTKLPNEQRILELERRLASLAAELNSLKLERNPSTPDQIVRPVRTVDPTEGVYPTGGNASPIVFLDAVHSGLDETVDLTERSASQQNVAATIDDTLVPVDTTGLAFRYMRQWFFVPGAAVPTMFLFQAPEGGIPARDGVTPGSVDTCTRMVYSDDFDEIQRMALSTVTVKNFASTDVCASGDRLGIAIQFGGVNWVIAEDCNDESDTEFPLES